MRPSFGVLVAASLFAACTTPQVATSPAPSTAPATIAVTTPSAPTSTPTAVPATAAASTTPTAPANATATTAPTSAATNAPTPAAATPQPQTAVPTAPPAAPTPTAAPIPTAAPTPTAAPAPTVDPAAPRPMVVLVHSADNYLHVQFDRSMKQSGAGAANVLAAYQLDGKAFPAGSTIVCGSPTCDVVRIDMPENLVRGSAHILRVAGVMSSLGALISPDPTFTQFRTDLTGESG